MTRLLTTIAALTALGTASAQVPEAWKDWPFEVFQGIGPVEPPPADDGLPDAVGPVHPPARRDNQLDGLGGIWPNTPDPAFDLDALPSVSVNALGPVTAKSLVVAFVRAGQYEAAEKLAAQVWEKTGPTTGSAEVQVALVRACAEAERPQTAEPSVARLREARAPQAAAAGLALGWGYIRARDSEKSLPHFQTVLDGACTDAERLDAQVGLARGYLGRASYNTAEGEFDRLLATDLPEEVRNRVRTFKAECCFRQGRYAEAAQLLRDALDSSPEAPWGLWLRSDLAMVLHRCEKHRECIDAAEEFFGKHGSALQSHAEWWTHGRTALYYALRSFRELNRLEEGQNWAEELGGRFGSEWPVYSLQLRSRWLLPDAQPPSANHIESLSQLLTPAQHGRYGARGEAMACSELGHARYCAGDMGAAKALYEEGLRAIEKAKTSGAELDFDLREQRRVLQIHLDTITFLHEHPVWIEGVEPRPYDPRPSSIERRLKEAAVTGEARFGEPLLAVVELEALKAEGAPAELNWSADHEAISATLRPSQRGGGPLFATAQQVIVEVTPSLGAKEVRGILTVTSPQFPAYSLRIPVAVTAKPAVWAAPNTLYFGAVARGQSRTASVVVASAGVAFDITEVQIDDADRVSVEVRRQTANAYRLAATLHGTPTPGATEGVVRVRTTLPDQPPLELTYYARVQ